MFKHFRIFLILVSILYFPIQSSAQSISIKPTELMKNAQVLYFSNFDLFNIGSAQFLFEVTINGIAAGNPADLGNTVIEIELELDGQVVSRAASDPFPTVLSNVNYTASNIDLIYNQTFPGSNMTINFNTELFSPDDQFENELYGSGKARRGIYRFKAKLYIDNALIQDYQTPIFKITNPSNIQLSSPGNRVGSNIPDEILTEFPVFAFFSDGTEFIVNVYEKLSHHQSVEDVINSGNKIFQSDPINFSVLDYATAANYGQAQPLQIGHTYYWYVDVLVPTTAGTEKIRSEIFQFKIVDTAGSTEEGTAVTSILELLRPIVGSQVDNISKDLSNFELKNIRLNGKPITIYELHQIIDSYDGHLIEVLDLVLY
jgi:hypothetical protein